jgi:hypothetical protein
MLYRVPVATRVVKPKKTCCKSRPRCKRCAVVCKRLAGQGLAEKLPNGTFLLDVDIRKKVLKKARG